jgi:hypothetical protein
MTWLMFVVKNQVMRYCFQLINYETTKLRENFGHGLGVRWFQHPHHIEHLDNMWISVVLLLSVSFTCVNPHCSMKVDWGCMPHVGGQIVFPKTEKNRTCKISLTIFMAFYLKNHFSILDIHPMDACKCNMSASSPSLMAVPRSIRSQEIHRFEENTNTYDKHHWVSYTNEMTNKTWAKQLTF